MLDLLQISTVPFPPSDFLDPLTLAYIYIYIHGQGLHPKYTLDMYWVYTDI